ncbi:hypothetical protein ACJX0J_027609, partial [Zea mays]
YGGDTNLLTVCGLNEHFGGLNIDLPKTSHKKEGPDNTSPWWGWGSTVPQMIINSHTKSCAGTFQRSTLQTQTQTQGFIQDLNSFLLPQQFPTQTETEFPLLKEEAHIKQA